MPRRKRGGDPDSSAAKRRKQKEYRRNKTEEEHEARLQNQRTRMTTLRSRKSEERKENKSIEESRILKDNLYYLLLRPYYYIYCWLAGKRTSDVSEKENVESTPCTFTEPPLKKARYDEIVKNIKIKEYTVRSTRQDTNPILRLLNAL
ncbi:unnamed protein product [Euphydryas editha]|uniref:Uncharacterized protein n=1 Tax=Euphydryas editha TaxID=104508 RepID=A0AAU9TPH7_EUPED|nr:unnamed protein product [Euphydryas editha]